MTKLTGCGCKQNECKRHNNNKRALANIKSSLSKLNGRALTRGAF